MSLPYPFPFWVVAEQKKQRGREREVTVSLAILSMVELTLHPRPCPWHSLFLCRKAAAVLAIVAYPNSFLAYPNGAGHPHDWSPCTPLLLAYPKFAWPLTGLPKWKFLEPPLPKRDVNLPTDQPAGYPVTSLPSTVNWWIKKACDWWPIIPD